jgi:Lysozyme inhibitor LprI
MRGMKTKLFLAAAVLVPSIAFAECLLETESDRQIELLQTAERAWLEYRSATCELFSERDDEALRAEAMATCLAFYTRERELELRLMAQVLTFTNVRSILAAE